MASDTKPMLRKLYWCALCALMFWCAGAFGCFVNEGPSLWYWTRACGLTLLVIVPGFALLWFMVLLVAGAVVAFIASNDTIRHAFLDGNGPLRSPPRRRR